MRVIGKGTVFDMPEEWTSKLPPTAVILTEEVPVVPLVRKEIDTFSEMNRLQELKRETAEAIAEDTHAALEASKKEQARRNRIAGAAKARAKKNVKQEEQNV